VFFHLPKKSRVAVQLPLLFPAIALRAITAIFILSVFLTGIQIQETILNRFSPHTLRSVSGDVSMASNTAKIPTAISKTA